jgi:hypothetical protein
VDEELCKKMSTVSSKCHMEQISVAIMQLFF